MTWNEMPWLLHSCVILSTIQVNLYRYHRFRDANLITLGILFLTTNRVKTFDEAFLSRIHVALHFQDLTREARKQVWSAFLKKTDSHITQEDLTQLAEKELNGRQIKNATRTANSLAVGSGKRLEYQNIADVLAIISQFSADFAAMSHDA